MSNKTKVKVEFMITGSQPLPELTDLLEIESSETWQLGDKIGNSIIKRKHYGWSICSGEKAIDVEKQILFLLDILTPKANLINSLRQEYNFECTFACAIDVHRRFYPPIHLEADTIHKVSLIGAEIDIDII